MPSFRQKVLQVISQIPAGQVASYGQIASLAGKPRAARQVGWILSSLPQDTKVPWWRVINSKGYLSIRNEDVGAKQLQKALLLQEGITISEDFQVDIDKYRWTAVLLKETIHSE